MLAYAVRFNITEIMLFYPNTINDTQEDSSKIIIEDALAGNKEVIVKAFQLPIINKLIFEQEFTSQQKIEQIFKSTKAELIEKIEHIIFTYP